MVLIEYGVSPQPFPAPEASRFVQSYMVSEGQVGLLWLDGQFGGFLDAGTQRGVQTS